MLKPQLHGPLPSSTGDTQQQHPVLAACCTVASMRLFAIAPSAAYQVRRLLYYRYKLVVATTEAVLLAHAPESAAAPPRKLSWRGRAPAQAAQPEQDAATCACWLGTKGDAFAVGYASGVVRLYSIPELALGVELFYYLRSTSSACERPPFSSFAGLANLTPSHRHMDEMYAPVHISYIAPLA